MAANVKFLIYAYGNVVYGEEGASYDSEPLRKIRLRTDANYKDLLNETCDKVKIDTSAHQINKVLHRHPKFVGGRVRYSLVPIRDDSDVEDLIEMAEKMGEGSIQELYIETSNRPIGLSEHGMLQVDASTAQAPRSKHDRISENKDPVHKRPQYDIDSSETGKNLVVADFRNEDPSQNLMIYQSCDPTAFPMPPSPMLMDITNGKVENQKPRASSSSTPPYGQDYEEFGCLGIMKNFMLVRRLVLNFSKQSRVLEFQSQLSLKITHLAHGALRSLSKF